MIGLAYAIGAERWERSETREQLRALGEGALNTALGALGTIGILSVAAACALKR